MSTEKAKAVDPKDQKIEQLERQLKELTAIANGYKMKSDQLEQLSFIQNGQADNNSSK